jgi:hypothetical protein
VHIYFPPWRALSVALLTTRISLSHTWFFSFSFIFFCVRSFFPCWDSYFPPDGFHLSNAHSQRSSLKFFHSPSLFHLFLPFPIPSCFTHPLCFCNVLSLPM